MKELHSNLVSIRSVLRSNPVEVETIRSIRNSFLGTDVYPEDHFIELDEHQAWFNSLDPDRDFFFLVRQESEIVGLVGCYQKPAPPGEAEVSIYITAPTSAMVPFHAMALLLRFIFEDLHLEAAYASFGKKNERALRFNLSLGFEQCSEDETRIKTRMTRPMYAAPKARFARLQEPPKSPLRGAGGPPAPRRVD